MMSDNTLNTILTQRGYQRIPSPDLMWRSWLWVTPLRDDGIPTKLCNGQWNLTEEVLHWLLDHECELKSQHYTDEQRGLTNAAIGRALGVSASTAGMILQGRHIRTFHDEQIAQLAGILGITFERC